MKDGIEVGCVSERLGWMKGVDRKWMMMNDDDGPWCCGRVVVILDEDDLP